MPSPSRVHPLALALALVLVVQVAVPAALGHSGGDHADGEAADSSGVGLALTPDREFAEQLHPDMEGPRVVWQERTPDDDWEIMRVNLSDDGSAVPLTNTDHDEKRPVTEGHWVAWEVFTPDNPDEPNLAVLNVTSGRLHHVPDTGGSEQDPTFGGNGSLYYRVGTRGDAQLRGFDPETGEVFKPIGDTEIVGEPAAHGPWLAWAEGSSTSVKLHVKDTRTGNVTEVPKSYHLEEGPVMGPVGLAWVARYGGQFSDGTYTTVYNLTTGIDKLRSKVYPHRQLELCPTGVVWNQPGTAGTSSPTVAIWDRFVEGTVTFGSNTFQGTCGDDHLVFEYNTRGESRSRAGTRQLRFVDLENYRLRREATITLKPEYRRGILRAPETFEGTVTPGDPREPIRRVVAQIDARAPAAMNLEPVEDGVVWNGTIDPRDLGSGEHKLLITAVDDQGYRTTREFTFFTETPYQLDPDKLGDGPNVPREASSPFPLSVFNHYQTYQPFYNTVLLVLAVLVGGGWYGYRRYQEGPTRRPEYVPPDEAGPRG